MKFRKGSKVEVLRTKQQTNCWFPGRITSVDGDQYIIKYEQVLNLEGDSVVEKVNQEDIRPQRPTTKEEEKWMAGDIAEVFDIHCWRVGKVVKVLKSNRYVIRLSRCIQLKEFHQSSLRVRQAWQNFKWIVLGKVVDGDKRLSPKYSLGLGSDAPQQGIQEEINSRENEDQEHLKIFHHVRTIKRSRSFHFDGAVLELANKKRKMTIKTGGCDGLPMKIPPFSKQVDAVSFAEANVGKSCIFGYLEKRTEMEKTSNYSIHPFSFSTQISEDSNGCSVASCSGNDLPEYIVQTTRKSFKDITDGSCDDAESMCPSASWREYLPSEDAFEANVHELELHAYRRTLQALFASGPLSWEQESLLTNLRLSLHISNEEHLLLLRQLLSAQDF